MVDDHSTDRTAEIARGFAGVTVMEAAKLEPGWTGKDNAIWTAARQARGRWLLFTDADTMHEPGRSAPRDARGRAAQGGHVELLAAADRERAWRSGR